MRKSDDCSLTAEQYSSVCKKAEYALRSAGAFGVFPTPIEDILSAQKLELEHENVFELSFLKKIRKRASSALKSAIGKVIGLFHIPGKIIFIDKTVMAIKQTFLKLHEIGHYILPWQRKMYAVVEDCKQTIDPEIADLFEREANVFASEVLFQRNTFIEEALDDPFGIKVPMKLSKKYGASVYASIRQYVQKNPRSCIVLVLNPPELIDGSGFRAHLRREIVSPSFKRVFGEFNWPAYFSPDDEIGAIIPMGSKRMSSPKEIILTDRNGTEHNCIAESFKHPYNVFILIHVVQELTKKSVLISR
ncbi:MAG: ImmA/IrrE family metallo-endopeptidase [Nitrospiraceae bacterium]|nr:ImmA/IrrE family metallo-endopeptidase [Nitrospiraceae bacterium]